MKGTAARNIIIFSVVVIVSGWLGVLLDNVIVNPTNPEGESLGMGLWLVLPLITTVLLRVFFGDGWKDAGFEPKFKDNIKWYVIAVLIYPLVTAIVVLLGVLTGWISISGLNMGAFALVFSSTLIAGFVKNIFEESVWRGYLTSKLLKLNLSDSTIYLIVGGIWGAWHIPYYLVFLPAADMYAILPVSRSVFAVAAIGTMIGWSVMFVELYRVTRSISPCVLAHMVEDALINPLVIDGYISISSGKEIFISPITGVITTLLYLSVGLLIRGWRINRERRMNLSYIPF